MKPVVSREFKSRVLQERLSGISCSALAKKYNLQRSTVASWVSVAKIIPKKEKKIKLKKQYKLNPQSKSLFLEEYNKGGVISELCKKMNLGESVVRRWLKREGLKNRKDVKGAAKKKKILQLHNDGLNVKEIQQEIGATYQSVILTLWTSGISPHPHKRTVKRRKLDIDYFEQIDSFEKAYYLGLLFSDGCVQSKCTRISISLKKPDSYLIESLVRALKSDAPIVEFYPKLSKTPGVRVAFYSKKMCKDLCNLGCVDNKSLILQFPIIPDRYLWSFIRGFFDGDGCISFSKGNKNGYAKRITMATSIYFNSRLKEILYEKYQISACLSIDKRNPRYTDLIIYKQEDVIKFRDLMYENDFLSLKRKKDRLYQDLFKKPVLYKDAA